ncbi:MAG: helix-turn-helix domain-containing protein [Gaiellales bacterium]|nr:MAG: helix-turn-helix domain-containing protein [Gaiellales bacterium]
MAKSGRRISPRLKFQVVLELISGEKTPAQIAKAYGVHPNSVGLWKKRFLEQGPQIFENESSQNEVEKSSQRWNGCWAKRKSRSSF